MTYSLPPSVNWHLNRQCTMKCAFCFGRFQDVPKSLIIRAPSTAARLAAMLAECFEKITLTGGEPLLCPFIEELLAICKTHGCTTSLVSNGSPLVRDPSRVSRLAKLVDWFGLSVDSSRPKVLQRLGRAPFSGAILPDQYIALANGLRAVGIRLKVNVVVTRLNVGEDMRWFLRELGPKRVKLFQVMPVFGQNDGSADELLILEEEFERFVDLHQMTDIPVVAESNNLMSGSYAMLDPAGRFFDNTTGKHRYSRSVLEAGVEESFNQISFDLGKFDERGGHYDWR